MLYQKAHIAYCSNVHPGQSLKQVTDNIQSHFTTIRNRRHIPNMASGLWLSASAAKSLLEDQPIDESASQLDQFKQCLNDNGMLLTSLNGFPYGNFHQGVVKKDVYLPTWAQPERLAYTTNLAQILAQCLPDDIHFGAISTVPLGYAELWDGIQNKQALNYFTALIENLTDIENNIGKRICICIEMEPDCVLQSTDQLLSFFNNDLLPYAASNNISKDTVLRYIGCCFDTCHQGVMNENITEALTKITDSGITIGKIQISNAINARLQNKNDVKQLTQLFKDEKFLHQTKLFNNNTLIAELADLEEHTLVKQLENVSEAEQSVITAKIHYHIPINQTDFSETFLSSTQNAIEETLDFLAINIEKNKQLPYLEIETYTWLNFLSTNTIKDKSSVLHQGIVDEFTWLENALNKRNILHTPIN